MSKVKNAFKEIQDVIENIANNKFKEKLTTNKSSIE